MESAQQLALRTNKPSSILAAPVAHRSNAATGDGVVRSPNRLSGQPRGQSGFSLIEVLLAVAVSGIVVAAISGAMLTLARVTTQASKHQRVTAAMTSFSESIKALHYIDCGGPGTGAPGASYDYAGSPGALDAETLRVDSIEILSVDYWDNDAGTLPGEGDFVDVTSSGCPPALPVENGGPMVMAVTTDDPSPDQGAQLFTVEVRLGDVVQRSTVAKRRP